MKLSSQLVRLSGFILFAAAAMPSISATSITWTGGGGTGNWSAAANWNPSTAIAVNTNDVLQFNGVIGLVNTNDVAGDTNAGIIFLPGAGAFTLNPGAGGTTFLGGNINNASANLQTVNQNLRLTGANRAMVTEDASNNLGAILITGVISQDSSARSLSFFSQPGNYQLSQGEASGGGGVTLTAANTYAGTTTLGVQNGGNGGVGNLANVMNGSGFGTLTLDFSASGAPANNILYNGVATPGQMNLDMGSTLLIKGAPGANNANQFGNLSFAIGLNTVQLEAGAGGTLTATFGTLTVPDQNNNSRAGAINFVLGPNTTVTTTSANNGSTGILNNSSWAGASYIVNGTDWACVSNGLIVPCNNYQPDAYASANANLDVITSGNVLSANVATIRFNQNASLILSNTAPATLENCALLMTPNVGANTNIITGAGTMAIGVVRGFLIYNFDTNANSELVIDCPLANSGGAQITFCGPGLTMLTQSNQPTQAGVNSLIGGARLLINGNACLGDPASTGAVQMDNGTLMVETNMALDNNNGGGLDARPIVLGTHGGAFDVSGANTLTVTGVVVGTNGGSLTKLDTGTLKLTAANTYAGPTFVEGGTLAISQTPTGTGAMVVNDGATLEDVGSVSLKPAILELGNSTGCTNTFTGVNSQTTAPIQTTTLYANGTTTINVASSTLSAGVYPLISFSSMVGAGNFVIGALPLGVAAGIVTNNGTNIALNVISTGTPDIWKGNISSNWDTVTANWLFNNATATFDNGNLVRFDDTAFQFDVNVAANVSPAGLTVTNSQNAYTFSGTNSIGGSGGLVKAGTNSLTIAVDYAATGGITVNQGTLIIGDGTSNGQVTASGIVDNSTVVFTDTNAAFSEGISGAGSVVVDITTNGVMDLGGINTYLGNTVIQSGTVTAIGAASIPNEPGGGILVVNQNGVLNVNNNPLTVNGLSGGGVVDNLTSPEVLFTVGANNANSIFAGSLSNGVGLLDFAKIGAGTLYLTGTNYNTGLYEFDAGIVNAASFSDYEDLGTTNSGPCAVGNRSRSQESATGNSVGLLFQGGTLQYTGSTPQETDRAIRLLDGVTSTIDASGSNPNATLYWSFGDTIGGNINLFETPGPRTLQLTGANTGTNTFDIQITDQVASATSVTKSGSGTWYMLGGALVGPNEYSGPTAINGGVLVISTTHNDSSGSPASANGLGPFTIKDGAALGVTDGANSQPALISTLTVGSSAGATLEFLNIPSTGVPMISATRTVLTGTASIVCSTNNLVVGTVYPLLAYGTLSGSYSLTAMPGPLYYQLTNDTVNIDLVVSSTPFVNTNSTNITFSVTGAPAPGSQLTLSWPVDYTGWRLLEQTNNLQSGVSTNPADWTTVPGSASTNQVIVTIGSSNEFFKMVYP